MKCQECQSDNSKKRKFCRACGAELQLICPQCGSENSPKHKFCAECGYNLAIPKEQTLNYLSLNEKLAKIQKYLPEGLSERVLTQRTKIEGERKQLTVMFCDLVEFTSFVEKAGPEEAYSIMDRLYELLIHKVHDYGGTVNEMTGDGIMALFGAPIALEDAPQRAIYSAIAIQRGISKFNDKIREDKKNIVPFKMRIGINTGLVVVGSLGNDLRVQFTAVGDTVNLAARLENLAEPGTIYVSEETYNLTQGLFRFEALGEKRIKGKTQPVKIYRVLAANTRKTRFDVSAESGLTPLIARERELELLIDAFERVKAGKGQVVSVKSEAGVGKSRLIYEFKKEIFDQGVSFLEGRCLSYSRHVTYHPIRDMLKATFDIKEGDSDSRITEKVKRGLSLLNIDESDTLPYLLELLSLGDSGIDKISMSPEAKKHRIIDALKSLVKKGSKIKVLILIFEDLHWIDRSSEEVLKSIHDDIEDVKVLAIFTYRPDFVNSWGVKPYHSHVTLNRLSKRQSLLMAANILATENIANELQELILEKTEGVPFFIEEFIKSLRDLNIINKKGGKYQLQKSIERFETPSSIQDVIMARVDSLPSGAKEVLQVSSVIERDFSYELIRQVMSLPENELDRWLCTLRDSGLLYGRDEQLETIYSFNHALTRQVVYDSILSQKKQTVHSLIAHSMECIYKEKITEHYAEIAEHFLAAGKYQNAAQYLKLAATKAEKAGALNDAIEHAKSRVQSLDKVIYTNELQDDVIDARVALGFYLFQMGYFVEAKEAVIPIVAILEKRGSSIPLAMISVFLGAYEYIVKEDFSESVQYLGKAESISEELGDFVSFGFSTYLFGLVLAFNCDFEQACYYFEKLLRMSMAIQSMWRVSAMKSNLSVYAYDYQGKVSLGYQTSQEAVNIAEKSGDIFSKAMAYTNHGTSCYYMGLLDEAESYLITAVSLTEKIELRSHSALAHQWLAHTLVDSGRYRDAQDHYRETIRIRKHSGLFPSSVHLNKVALIKARLLTGAENVNINQLYFHAKQNKVKLYEGWMARFISEILLHLGEPHFTISEEWITKAIEADGKNGMMLDVGRDFGVYGQLLTIGGHLTKAREALERAVKLFQECGADGWVQKYTTVLSKL